MLAANALVLICDALTWLFELQPQYTIMLYALNFLVYSLGYVITALFSTYLFTYIAERKPIPLQFVRIINHMCAVAVLLVVLSLFNHMFFSFDGGVYIRGPLYWLSQVYSICILLVDMCVVLYYRKALGLSDTLALLSYSVLPAIALAVQVYILGITLLYLATTASLLIIYVRIHVEQGIRLKNQEAALAESRVAIMLSQIQPHFLYNTLTTIRGLCREDPPMAEKATVEFSNFLRGNLDSLTASKPIPFERELTHTKSYLNLEKMRFQERLNVQYDIRCTSFFIPTLTLQPLAENAVHHGITSIERGGVVTISSYETDTSYIISVSDNGVGFDLNEQKDDGRAHIGIQNVRERLSQISNGTLKIESTSGVGTTAYIAIPK